MGESDSRHREEMLIDVVKAETVQCRPGLSAAGLSGDGSRLSRDNCRIER
jgi:hypothetical protein